MMNNFIYSIPTTICFGKGQIEKLPAALKEYGDKVLLVYGGGNIKRSGLYDTIVSLFQQNGIDWVELSGVDPNPRITSVREGVELCRMHQVSVVLAVGGGSSIDCAKVIAGGAFYDGDAWDLVTGKVPYTGALPIFSVLTLSATGSEMDDGAVITNLETREKLCTGSPFLLPKCSILDPSYTFTVGKRQTAAGTADIISHIFEVYFSPVKTGYLQDRMAEAMLKTCIHYGPIALAEPDNYEARANLMWTSSLAINGLLSLGKGNGWTVHPIQHELGAYYDITHGEGLAILTPAWMREILSEDTVDKFAAYGVNVFDIDKSLPHQEIAELAIQKTQDFFVHALGIPATLRELGVEDTYFEQMGQRLAPLLKSAYVPLTARQVVSIYKACY